MDPVDFATSKTSPPKVSTRKPSPTVESFGILPVAAGLADDPGVVVIGFEVDVVVVVVGAELPGRHW